MSEFPPSSSSSSVLAASSTTDAAVAAAPASLDRFSGASMADLFDEAQRVHTELTEGDELSSSDAEYQKKVEHAYLQLLTVSKRVQQASLFSVNDELADISTTSLKYLLVPYYLGSLLSMFQGGSRERLTRLQKSIFYMQQYLAMCERFQLLNLDQLSQWRRKPGDTVTPQQLRAEKINQHRAQTKLKSQLAALFQKRDERRKKNKRKQHRSVSQKDIGDAGASVGPAADWGEEKNPAAGGAGKSSKGSLNDEEEEEDEQQRACLKIVMEIACTEALNNIKYGSQELDFLRRRVVEEADPAAAAAARQPSINLIRPAVSGQQQPAQQHQLQRAGDRKRAGQASAGGKPKVYEVKSASDVGKLPASVQRSVKSGVSQASLNQLVKMQQVRERVFQNPNAPTKTMDQWIDEQRAAGLLPEAATQPRAPKIGFVHKSAERDAAAAVEALSSDDEKEDVLDGDTAAQDAATYKARNWDNWKDDHNKGEGNKPNASYSRARSGD